MQTFLLAEKYAHYRHISSYHWICISNPDRNKSKMTQRNKPYQTSMNALHNNPKYSDRQGGQTGQNQISSRTSRSSLTRVLTVCYFVCIFWEPRPIVRSDAGRMRIRLVFRRSQFRSPGPATFFRGDVSWKLIISMTILSLPLIQVGQLSITGKRMCTKYWLTAYV